MRQRTCRAGREIASQPSQRQPDPLCCSIGLLSITEVDKESTFKTTKAFSCLEIIRGPIRVTSH